MLALQASIFGTVLGFGLKATPDDLLYLVRRPGLLLRSLLAVFVIMPVVAVALVRIFDFRHAAEVALVALAISPAPPLLPGREGRAGGHASYGLGLMAMLAVLAIVVIPLEVAILGPVFGQSFAVAPQTIAGIVLKAVILPLAAGMLIRAAWPARADRIARPVGLVATVLLAVAGLALLAGTWRGVWEAVGSGSLLAMVAFVAAGLLVGHLLGGPDPQHAVVLALTSACRHPAIAFAIAAANFPGEHFAGTIILYLLVNLVAGAPYLAWLRRRAADTLSPGASRSSRAA
jgi:BASS family bile acid:Na+ symporter